MKRLYHLTKSISYRVYSSAITFGISYYATGNAEIGLKIGIADFVIKIVSYYIHERLWFAMEKINSARKH